MHDLTNWIQARLIVIGILFLLIQIIRIARHAGKKPTAQAHRRFDPRRLP